MNQHQLLYVKGVKNRAGLSGLFVCLLVYYIFCDMFGGTIIFTLVWMEEQRLDYILALDIT